MSDAATLSEDIDLESFRLKSRKHTALLIGALEREGQNEIETTIDGASTLTLTVRDSGRELRSMFDSVLSLTAAGLKWECSPQAGGVSKSGDTFTLTFEQKVVADLRRQRRRGKARRGKMTRAQFVRSRVISTVKRSGGRFICPELNRRQPIAKTRRSRSGKDDRRERGFAKGTKIQGKEGPINLHNAEIALDVAADEKAGTKATLALMLAGIVEGPDFANPRGGDGTSSGPLQVTSETARALGLNPRDAEAVFRAFLTRGFTGKGGAIALARKHPNWSAGRIAQEVQGSAFGHRYGQYESQGKKLIDAYGGAVAGGSSRSFKKYEFTQGPPGGPKNENAWDMALRLAEEVGWRRFFVGDDFYFMAEADLIKSRPRITISEKAPGVDWIDYDQRAGADIDQCTVRCRAGRWTAPPGSVALIDGEGQADGRWLVSTIRRPIFKSDSTIELRRGRALTREKREPAPEPKERTSSGKETGTTGGGRGSSGDFQRPVEGGSVPNGGQFGATRPGGRKHAGIDFAVPVGTPVVAALGGTVERVATDAGGYGLYLDIRHADGYMTRYAHLSRVLGPDVAKGRRVTRGQRVALSGNTGRSSGPHLHFEIHKGGVPQNPANLL